VDDDVGQLFVYLTTPHTLDRRHGTAVRRRTFTRDTLRVTVETDAVAVETLSHGRRHCRDVTSRGWRQKTWNIFEQMRRV